MGPLRIVLVDDHEMVLQGLTTILGRFLGRVRVVSQALDAAGAQKLAATLKPDIVLCDVRLKGTSGLDLCRQLVERDPAAKVVLLSAYDDEQYLFQAMRVGARGYLLKQITGEDLVRHLERVADGETAIDASLAGRAGSSSARKRSRATCDRFTASWRSATGPARSRSRCAKASSIDRVHPAQRPGAGRRRG